MIGLVIVSHSARLAEGVCELAEQVAQGRVRLAAAGGAADPEHPIGTDAFKVQQAIESVYSEDGVLVLTDLGSAVLSAETALEFLEEDKRGHVKLCSAPLVEGAVAAASQAAAGASMEEILREVEAALAVARPVAAESSQERLVTLTNALGLHARPAAKLIRIARRFQALVTIENVTHAAARSKPLASTAFSAWARGRDIDYGYGRTDPMRARLSRNWRCLLRGDAATRTNRPNSPNSPESPCHRPPES